MATQLLPYLFLYGRAEEALEFYKDVFGGTYQAMRASDSPMGANVPPEAAGRVMHARFTADDATFMLSDGMQTKAVDSDAGNISLSLEFEDASRGERIFEGLSAGGNVMQPIDAAFWGGRFGVVVDKFGTEWLVSLP